MDSFPVLSYFPLFLTSYQECLDGIKNHFPPQSPLDRSEIHRFFHMLKSQNSFMGYHQSAQYCLLIQKIFLSLKETNLPLSEELKTLTNEIIKTLEENLVSLKSQKKEIDLTNKINELKNFSQTSV